MMKKIFLILLFLICFTSLEAQQTICLNMIVKDESRVIRRVIDSVRDIVDYWVIVDTGSTDGTQDVIREHLKDMPGELHERPWKNFSHNRNEALELAKGKADFTLIMDADDWLSFEANFTLPELSADCYNILWTHGEHFSYLKPQMIRSALPWKWVGVLHEYLACDIPYTSETLENVKYCYGGDGASWGDPEKYAKNAATFRQGLEDEPGNSRYMFYLGESLRDAGEPAEAIDAYRNRIEMGGWDQEIFWSYYQIGLLKQRLEHPTDEVIAAYIQAHHYRPHRAEPVYALAEIFNQTGRHALAYALIKGWQTIPQPPTKDVLFNLNWMDDYGIDFQLSLSAFYLDKKGEFVTACEKVLEAPNLPPHWADQTKANRALITSIENQSVLISVDATAKVPVLPEYLRCIEALDYDKSLITLHVRADQMQPHLDEWINNMAPQYGAIVVDRHDSPLGKAKKLGCDYCFEIDPRVVLTSNALYDLMQQNCAIATPQLQKTAPWGSDKNTTSLTKCSVEGAVEPTVCDGQTYGFLIALPPTPSPLIGRIPPDNARYATFDKAFQLIAERGLNTIIETGTARCGADNFIGDGGSTVMFSEWAHMQPDAHFISVDINQQNLDGAAAALEFMDATTLVCDDSLHFLETFEEQIDFLYLDSYDFEFDNPAPSQEHHLKEIQSAYDKLSPNCVVMIDDCDLPHGGKGKLAIQYLENLGWHKVLDSYQVILSR